MKVTSNSYPQKHIYYSNGLMLVIGALMVLTLWNVTYRDFGKLGFQDILISPLPCGLWQALPSSMRVIHCTMWQSKRMPTNGRIYRTSCQRAGRIIVILFFALAAGSCEEIIFRGFMINYVAEMTSSFSYAEAVAFNRTCLYIFHQPHLPGLGICSENCFNFSLVWCFVYVHHFPCTWL